MSSLPRGSTRNLGSELRGVLPTSRPCLEGHGKSAAIAQACVSESNCLNRLVRAYRGLCRIERAHATQIDQVAGVFQDVAGLVVFPRFEVDEVIDAVRGGQLFPTGLTRFVVSPRALRLGYPLDGLLETRPLRAKQRDLEEWIRVQVGERRVRHYLEEIFLFDESTQEYSDIHRVLRRLRWEKGTDPVSFLGWCPCALCDVGAKESRSKRGSQGAASCTPCPLILGRGARRTSGLQRRQSLRIATRLQSWQVRPDFGHCVRMGRG